MAKADVKKPPVLVMSNNHQDFLQKIRILIEDGYSPFDQLMIEHNPSNQYQCFIQNMKYNSNIRISEYVLISVLYSNNSYYTMGDDDKYNNEIKNLLEKGYQLYGNIVHVNPGRKLFQVLIKTIE